MSDCTVLLQLSFSHSHHVDHLSSLKFNSVILLSSYQQKRMWLTSPADTCHHLSWIDVQAQTAQHSVSICHDLCTLIFCACTCPSQTCLADLRKGTHSVFLLDSLPFQGFVHFVLHSKALGSWSNVDAPVIVVPFIITCLATLVSTVYDLNHNSQPSAKSSLVSSSMWRYYHQPEPPSSTVFCQRSLLSKSFPCS